MKALRILCALLFVGGASLTARALYMHAKAELAGVLIRRAWEQSLQSGESHAPWPWADTHPIARLRIPRLGYDEIVLEGATPRTLAFGPARLFSGARLGEPEIWCLQAIAPVGSVPWKRSPPETALKSNGLILASAACISEPTPWM